MNTQQVQCPSIVKVDEQGKDIVRNLLLNSHLENRSESKCQGR
jgi:hypothetical protein